MADWKYAFKSFKNKLKETEQSNITEQVLLHFWKEKARQGSALDN